LTPKFQIWRQNFKNSNLAPKLQNSNLALKLQKFKFGAKITKFKISPPKKLNLAPKSKNSNFYRRKFAENSPKNSNEQRRTSKLEKRRENQFAPLPAPDVASSAAPPCRLCNVPPTERQQDGRHVEQTVVSRLFRIKR
jgi:hypothetical protein